MHQAKAEGVGRTRVPPSGLANRQVSGGPPPAPRSIVERSAATQAAGGQGQSHCSYTAVPMRHYGVERLEELPSRTAEKLRRQLQEIR
jgi:hypothetical protein